MKKFLAIILASLLLLSLVACGKDDNNTKLDTAEGDKSFTNNDLGSFTYEINQHGYYSITGFSTSSASELSLEIPSKIDEIKVTGIANDAFKSNTNLISISIPDSITFIGDFAFYGCTSITEITLPNSITEIGVGAFRNCTALKQVKLSENLLEIGDEAFWECTSLENVTLANTLVEIGDGAFWGCDTITEVIIPSSVTKIGKTAFYGCEKLARIVVPASVNEIGEAAFSALTSEKVVIEGETGSLIETYFKANYIDNSIDYTHYEFIAIENN